MLTRWVILAKIAAFDLREHTVPEDCNAYFCSDAYHINATPHPMRANRIGAYHSTKDIVAIPNGTWCWGMWAQDAIFTKNGGTNFKRYSF
jgi:hypothetical protein